jgi:hypothetical protein
VSLHRPRSAAFTLSCSSHIMGASGGASSVPNYLVLSLAACRRLRPGEPADSPTAHAHPHPKVGLHPNPGTPPSVYMMAAVEKMSPDAALLQ